MKKKIIALFILFLFIIAFCLLVTYSQNMLKTPDESIIEPEDLYFSLPSGIYTKNISVKLVSSKPADIYYTLNGEEPTQSSRKYGYQINIVAEEKDKCMSISAKAFYEDGSFSDTVIGTYYVGLKADTRFTTPVAFITSDPDKLFGYENGILVAGKLRDDFIKYQPKETVISISPANFNLRGIVSERDVHFQLMDMSGSVVVSQALGLRPFGAYSRARKMKSLKMFPRYDYDSQFNKINYTIYGDDYSNDGKNLLITEYKRLVMHNSGNDNTGLMMKNSLYMQLSGDAGFPDIALSTPISVYINGDYYGFMWLNTAYCDEYFEDKYGAYQGVFEIVSGPERSKPDTRYPIDDMPQYAYDDYMEMYNKYSAADLTNDETYSALSNLMDIENYLFYYALNVYINNNDWPFNNHKVYRYYRAIDEEYTAGTVFDGRWRFMMHDVDNLRDGNGNLLNADLLSQTSSRRSPLFQQLMKREDCKEYFINKCIELMNGAFSEDNWVSSLDEMHQARLSELLRFIDESPYNGGTTMENVERIINTTKSTASRRGLYMINELKVAFKINPSTYEFSIGGEDHIFYTIGNYKCGEFKGKWLVDYGFTVIPTLEIGYKLDYWLVNGEKVFADSLEISHIADKIEVFPVVSKIKEYQNLLICEISSEGSFNDYIVLYNPNDFEVSSLGYKLSDSNDSSKIYVIPSRKIGAGQTLKIYCRDNTDYESLRQLFTPFNLKRGEILSLSYGNEIIQSIEIPNLHIGYVYRLNLSDSEFYEVAE